MTKCDLDLSSNFVSDRVWDHLDSGSWLSGQEKDLSIGVAAFKGRMFKNKSRILYVLNGQMAL